MSRHTGVNIRSVDTVDRKSRGQAGMGLMWKVGKPGVLQ